MSETLVHLPPETGASLQPYEVLVQEIVSLVGGQDDEELVEKARVLIDRAADEMNTAGVYLHQFKEVTYTAAVDYPTAQATLPLPSDWGWPEGRIAIYTGDSPVFHRFANWVDWHTFLKYRTKTAVSDNSDGKPKIAAMKSELDDEVHLYPYPDPDEASQIIIPYFSRISRPSEAALLFITPEIREALIIGGQAKIMQYRHAKLPNVWRPWVDHFERMIDKVRNADHRRQQALYYWSQVDMAPIYPYNSHPYGWHWSGS